MRSKVELRCDNKLHGSVDGAILEVSCDSRWCGKRPGVAIIHRFNFRTGELIETLQFKQPVRPKKGNTQC